jgi:hypothetical protein
VGQGGGRVREGCIQITRPASAKAQSRWMGGVGSILLYTHMHPRVRRMVLFLKQILRSTFAAGNPGLFSVVDNSHQLVACSKYERILLYSPLNSCRPRGSMFVSLLVP